MSGLTEDEIKHLRQVVDECDEEHRKVILEPSKVRALLDENEDLRTDVARLEGENNQRASVLSSVRAELEQVREEFRQYQIASFQ